MIQPMSSADTLKLSQALTGDFGNLLRISLAEESDTIETLAGELVFNTEKGPEAKAQEFAELNAEASHVHWTRKWLKSIGLETPPDDGRDQ
jgi:hypothetical protein